MIMRDVNLGWLIRYIHANGASFFFGCMYIHVGKALYYGSYRKPRVLVWIIGVIILIATMATGFMGYCLVYGQMSHWGATVITNLLSAIPFIGADIVPLISLIPLYLCIIYKCIDINKNIIDDISNKGEGDSLVLKNNKIHDDELNFSNLLSLIVGFIDGDGYIRVTKKKEYIYVALVINLHEGDYDLLCEIRDILNMGNVYYVTSNGKRLARLEINKTDFIKKFIPLLEKHNISFLTETRQTQFLKVKYIINNNCVFYDDINEQELLDFTINNIKLEGFNNLWFFNNWLVGFTMAEGSFLEKKNNDICFKLKQKNNFILFKEILEYLGTTQKLSINQGKYVEYSASSKKDIQLIIYFFSYNDFVIKPDIKCYSTVSLRGLKLISYNKWLLTIKESKRYSKLILPM